MSNIWVAAGDGDLRRVQELLQSTSPNEPDQFSYTPMHAAASYGHLQVLEYLIQKGGNVNVTDDDGDTPLYTVENVETASFLVQHGAIVDRRNNEGVSPIEHLGVDFPKVATYLCSTFGSSEPAATSPQQPSQHQQNMVSENLTSSLMTSVEDIMRRAEAEGQDPEEELRQIVSRTVLDGVVTGYEMTTMMDERRSSSDGGDTVKRPRTDKGPG